MRVAFIIALLAFTAPAPVQESPNSKPRPKIAVIPKGTTHVFWKSVEAGAKKAGEELNVEIIWKGPLKENDRAGQIQVVQQFVSQGVSGIVLAPLDLKALVAPVKAATDKKIPVVIFDSALDGQPGKDFVSLVATNNGNGGKLGGEELGRLLNKKGSVVVLRYQVGSASTDEREKGFLEAIKKAGEINVISDNRYAGATAGEAKTQALNMLDDIRNANGIFCPNESSTLGMLLALQQEGLAGKIKFVGFDASPPLLEALKKGEIDALVVQNPRKMGYLAVKALVQQLNGEKVEPTIDTGCALVTKANLDTPEIKALLEQPMRLQMSGIAKRFGATVALAGVDLEVRPGEVHALVGENGAGKSTLMKILAGAYQPDAGEMKLDGQPYRPRNPAAGRRAGVAMIYQELSLAPHLSVAENILLGAEPTLGPLIDWRTVRRRAGEALRQVGHVDIPLGVPVGRLPIAQQQLVEIARSVAVGCRVLVLDEPTSSLAQSDVRMLFELIRRMKADGHSILYISHFLEEVREISDRFTVLRDGASVGGGESAECSTDKIIAMMVGREVSDLYPRSARSPGEVVLELSDLAGLRLPQSAALSLRRGEVVGIAGLIGAGRTELLRAIFGLSPIRTGQVKIGAYVGPHSPAHRWAQRVGLVCEDRKSEGLALNLSIAENLTLPRLRNVGPLGLVTPGGQARAAWPWIESLPIKCLSAGQRVSELSGGNQQKVALARLLHADCDVLLLDEPTRGIDVASKAEIYRLINQLVAPGQGVQSSALLAAPIAALPRSRALHSPRESRPRAVLLVSSYLPELLGVCDRIGVMHRGRLGPVRPVTELDQHRIMFEAAGAGEAA